MLSDDGGEPPTKPKTPLAPTCRPFAPSCALMRFSTLVTWSVSRSSNVLALEGHRRVRDGAVGAHAGLAEVRLAPCAASRLVALLVVLAVALVAALVGRRRRALGPSGSPNGVCTHATPGMVEILVSRASVLAPAAPSVALPESAFQTTWPSRPAPVPADPLRSCEQVLGGRGLGVRQLEVVVVVAAEAESRGRRRPP